MLLTKKENYWIGMHRLENRQYVWADNSEVKYTNWAPGEPNGVDANEVIF